MASVIIPNKNELPVLERTLEKVTPINHEVIVVDGNSTDGSWDVIQAYSRNFDHIQGIRQSNLREGKGGALRDGLQISKDPIKVFLDADIETLETHWIDKLLEPFSFTDTDIVKANYEYSGNDFATQQIAKPLLKELFPEVFVNRPLEGEVAFHKNVLEKCKLENGFKVESCFLIDAFLHKYNVTEVFLGTKKHETQNGDNLKHLALEVTEGILNKAVEYERI